MKLRTSFFNFHIVKKDFSRFVPLWGLYTVFLLLVLFLQARKGTSGVFARNIYDSLNAMSWFNLIYGCICAGVLFEDLYLSRICNALHAFPVRREGWLTSHVVSGLLFAAIPNAVISVLASVILLQYFYMAWIWMAISMLQFIFFFGIGVLTAVCVGTRFSMTIFYAIIQFGAFLVYGVATSIYQPLLKGIQFDFQDFRYFIPTAHMSNYDDRYINFTYNPVTLEGKIIGLNESIWVYTVICAIIGLVAVFLSYFVYRNRKLETAGDVVSLKALEPVLLVIYAFGVGVFFCVLSDLFGEQSNAFFFAGLAVGFFTGMMFLRRTVKVFHVRNIIRFIIMAGIIFGSICVTSLDPWGVTSKIPEWGDVEWAAIYTPEQAYGYQLEENISRYSVTDQKEFERLQQLHEELMVAEIDEESDSCSEVTVQYQLKNGEKLTRYYKVDVDSELGQDLKKYLSDMRYIFQINDLAWLYSDLQAIQIECYDWDLSDQWHLNLETGVVDSVYIEDPKQIAGLLDAMNRDCQAGNMTQYYPFHRNEAQLYGLSVELPIGIGDTLDAQNLYGYEMESTTYYIGTVNIYDSCTNTIEYLRNLQF